MRSQCSQFKAIRRAFSKYVAAFFIAIIRYLVTTFAIGMYATASADIIIENARLFDATGTTLQENVSLRLSGRQIAEIGAMEMSHDDATVIDATGMTVMPGLIDAHVHSTVLLHDGQLTIPDNEAAMQVHLSGVVSEHLSNYLDEGFTSIVDPGGFWPHIIRLRDLIAAGEIRGPRMFVSGGIFTAPGGHPAAWICETETGDFCRTALNAEADDIDSARALVRRYADGGNGVDLVNIAYDGVIAPPKLRPEVVHAIIDEAHEQGIRAVAHVYDVRDIPDVVSWGIDGLVHPPSVVDDPEGKFLAAIGARQLPLSITFGATEYAILKNGEETLSEEDLSDYRTRRNNVITALDLGALPVYGSDSVEHPSLVRQMVVGSLVSSGLSNAEVLQAATRNAARLLGRGDLGTLQEGNIADILIVRGNPLGNLADLSNVAVVIKDGAIMHDRR